MNLEVIPNLHLQKEPSASRFVVRAIEELSQINAEGILDEELKKYNQILSRAGSFKVGLIVADDLSGGVLSREMVEIQRVMEVDPDLKKGVLSILWWTSDEVTSQKIRQVIAEQIFKALKVYDGKIVRTLSELISLEAQTLRFAKSQSSDKKRQMWFSDFAKYMPTADRGTMMACFYGDEAARRLGFRALGFPKAAGRSYANWIS